jgi:hypothetical protein
LIDVADFVGFPVFDDQIPFDDHQSFEKQPDREAECNHQYIQNQGGPMVTPAHERTDYTQQDQEESDPVSFGIIGYQRIALGTTVDLSAYGKQIDWQMFFAGRARIIQKIWGHILKFTILTGDRLIRVSQEIRFAKVF